MSIFTERVTKAALSIPKGRVTTYGRIARAAGSGGMAAQSIGRVLGKADALAESAGSKRVPFHRIVYANGKIWVDDAHRKERMQLYRAEGIVVDKNDRIKNFYDIVLDFN